MGFAQLGERGLRLVRRGVGAALDELAGDAGLVEARAQAFEGRDVVRRVVPEEHADAERWAGVGGWRRQQQEDTGDCGRERAEGVQRHAGRLTRSSTSAALDGAALPASFGEQSKHVLQSEVP